MKRLYCVEWSSDISSGLSILLLVSAAANLNGQNLIPNPSFEEIEAKNKENAREWYSPTDLKPKYWTGIGSPDLLRYNSNIKWGTQPAVGRYFVGIALILNESVNSTMGGGCEEHLKYREYLQIQLSDTLLQEKTYHISFAIALPSEVVNEVDSLGILLSSEEIHYDNFILGSEGTWIKPIPHVDESPQLWFSVNDLKNDTSAWTRVELKYQPKEAGLQYFVIGFFGGDDMVKPITERWSENEHDVVINRGLGCYYYLDDFSLNQVKEQSNRASFD